MNDKNMDAERAAFDAEACRKTCDICSDEVGNEWPCARKRVLSRRTSFAERAAPSPQQGKEGAN
jgi:hypothetical protein